MKKTAKFWTLAGSVLFTAGLTAASCGGETLSVPPDIEPADAGEIAADSGTGPVVIPPDCGDGVIQVTKGETCDDGNTESGDGCSSQCLLEEGWICPRPNEKCLPPSVCGDGRLDPSKGETCDDGDTTPGDGCSETCTTEAGWACLYAGSACQAAACGDGIAVGLCLRKRDRDRAEYLQDPR